MNDRERIIRWHEKEDLIDQLKATFGVEPQGLRQVITALSHPDVIAQTIAFFNGHDQSNTCTIYDNPWNCAREAEAKYETISQGLVGASLAGAWTELWCEPCRNRVMGDHITGDNWNE